ncbi:MAG: hypothetical protein ACRDZN_04385 [Acidimicrobiales bacterium]
MQGAIVWGGYQETHINERHKVSYPEVSEIIRTRAKRVIEEENHPGARYVLTGRTRADRQLVVVVTVQLDGDLFPVTAFDPTER